MVDINLIGDDKTGTGETDDTERVEDFTQTSSMDTQELAFEERTETFDTTKTAGFTQRRSSSVVSTLIILTVIALLGFGVYFFMFKDKGGSGQTQFAQFPEDTQDFVENLPQEEDANLDFAEELNSEPESDLDTGFQQQAQQQEQTPIQEPVQQPISRQPQRQPTREVEPPTPSNLPGADLTPIASQFLSNSKEAIQAVTNVLSVTPSNLNVTLLSYTAQNVRMEVVANSASDARDFANVLGQNFGGNFSVVSENPVPSNGTTKDKVLITGTMSSGGRSSGGAQFLSLSQAQNWFRQSVAQFGLELRQISALSSSFVTDYQRTPILLRVYGSQSSLVSFLEEISAQSINVELTKILMVSPDMVTHSDDNLVLVLNLLLYEPA